MDPEVFKQQKKSGVSPVLIWGLLIMSLSAIGLGFFVLQQASEDSNEVEVNKPPTVIRPHSTHKSESHPGPTIEGNDKVFTRSMEEFSNFGIHSGFSLAFTGGFTAETTSSVRVFPSNPGGVFRLPKLPKAVHLHRQVSSPLGTFTIVSGGRQYNAQGTFSNNHALFSVNAEQGWQRLPKFNFPRANHGLAWWQGGLVALGGSAREGELNPSVEYLSIRKDAFSNPMISTVDELVQPDPLTGLGGRNATWEILPSVPTSSLPAAIDFDAVGREFSTSLLAATEKDNGVYGAPAVTLPQTDTHPEELFLLGGFEGPIRNLATVRANVWALSIVKNAATRFDGLYFELPADRKEEIRSRLHAPEAEGFVWREVAPLPEPMANGCAVAVGYDHILWIGGRNKSQSVAAVWMYNRKSNKWTRLPSLKSNRVSPACQFIPRSIAQMEGFSTAATPQGMWPGVVAVFSGLMHGYPVLSAEMLPWPYGFDLERWPENLPEQEVVDYGDGVRGLNVLGNIPPVPEVQEAGEAGEEPAKSSVTVNEDGSINFSHSPSARARAARKAAKRSSSGGAAEKEVEAGGATVGDDRAVLRGWMDISLPNNKRNPLVTEHMDTVNFDIGLFIRPQGNSTIL